MKCIACKLEIFKREQQQSLLKKTELLSFFKDVPALVCDQCKKGYTDRDVTARLLQIVKEEATKGKELELVRYTA